jgi:hypothetical protein
MQSINNVQVCLNIGLTTTTLNSVTTMRQGDIKFFYIPQNLNRQKLEVYTFTNEFNKGKFTGTIQKYNNTLIHEIDGIKF